MCESHPEVVVGIVSQARLTRGPGLVQFTPGVAGAAAGGGDSLGQRWGRLLLLLLLLLLLQCDMIST